MKHIQLEPSEIRVCFDMTLQDLRNCELLVQKEIKVHEHSGVAMRQEVARRLRASLERITKARIASEKKAAEEHADGHEVIHTEERNA